MRAKSKRKLCEQKIARLERDHTSDRYKLSQRELRFTQHTGKVNTIAREVIRMLLVKSKVREVVNGHNKRASKEYMEALSRRVAEIIATSVNNCKALTLKARDLV